MVPPASDSENPLTLANINSKATQTEIQIKETCLLLAAIIINSDRSNEKDKNKDKNIYDQKIEQYAC